MNHPRLNPERLEKNLENKTRRRLGKKKPRMAVSGRSVLILQRLIKKKAAA